MSGKRIQFEKCKRFLNKRFFQDKIYYEKGSVINIIKANIIKI